MLHTLKFELRWQPLSFVGGLVLAGLGAYFAITHEAPVPPPGLALGTPLAGLVVPAAYLAALMGLGMAGWGWQKASRLAHGLPDSAGLPSFIAWAAIVVLALASIGLGFLVWILARHQWGAVWGSVWTAVAIVGPAVAIWRAAYGRH